METQENNVIPFPTLAERKKPKRTHTWGPSYLGHGNQQCTNCLCTDLEAKFALGPYCLEVKGRGC